MAKELGLEGFIMGTPLADRSVAYPDAYGRMLGVLISFSSRISDPELIFYWNKYWMLLEKVLCKDKDPICKVFEDTNSKEFKNFYIAIRHLKNEVTNSNSVYSNFVLGLF